MQVPLGVQDTAAKPLDEDPDGLGTGTLIHCEPFPAFASGTVKPPGFS